MAKQFNLTEENLKDRSVSKSKDKKNKTQKISTLYVKHRKSIDETNKLKPSGIKLFTKIGSMVQKHNNISTFKSPVNEQKDW